MTISYKSNIDNILSKFYPNYLDLYASIFGKLLNSLNYLLTVVWAAVIVVMYCYNLNLWCPSRNFNTNLEFFKTKFLSVGLPLYNYIMFFKHSASPPTIFPFLHRVPPCTLTPECLKKKDCMLCFVGTGQILLSRLHIITFIKVQMRKNACFVIMLEVNTFGMNEAISIMIVSMSRRKWKLIWKKNKTLKKEKRKRRLILTGRMKDRYFVEFCKYLLKFIFSSHHFFGSRIVYNYFFVWFQSFRAGFFNYLVVGDLHKN